MKILTDVLPLSETTLSYSHFGLVINKLSGNNVMIDFDNWEIYGKEEVLPQNADTGYKYLAFPYVSGSQTQYTVNFTQDTVCNILVVGGGGGGSGGIGGGGGGGGVSWIENTLLNGNVLIEVGNGGNGGVANAAGGSSGTKGGNSTITQGGIIINAKGGGTPYSGLNNGGSGSGADGYSPDGGLSTKGIQINNSAEPVTFNGGNVSYYGTDGGTKASSGYGGGGGGGAKNNISVNGGANIAGIGGEGIENINGNDLKTYFGLVNSDNIGEYHTDNKVYFGGGGGGSGGSSSSGTGQLGGLGGGGNGASGSGANGGVGTESTGGGGGAGSTGYGDGGKGGSGIVIIGYKTTTTINQSPYTVSFINVTDGDSINCEVLLLDDGKYNNIDNIYITPTNFSFNIKVGNGGFPSTIDDHTTDTQPAYNSGISNDITGTNILYNTSKVILKYRAKQPVYTDLPTTGHLQYDGTKWEVSNDLEQRIRYLEILCARLGVLL